MFTLEIEAILIAEYIMKLNLNLEFILYINDLLKPASSISVNNTVYTITVDIIQREEKVLTTINQE